MFQITKTPVVIFSTPRTGSTVLTAYIKKISNDPTIKAFSEPDYPSGNRMEEFLEVYNSNQKFVLKTHLVHIHRYDPKIAEFLTTSDSIFRIRIQRKDLIKQIASFYIAISRNNYWHHRTNDSTKLVDTIEINKSLLAKHISYILRSNKIIKESNIKFDLDLYYEDLPKMDNLTFYVNPKPTNYQEILDVVSEMVSRTGIEPV
jgi:hypothetical protein